MRADIEIVGVETGDHLEAKDMSTSLARALAALERIDAANASKPVCPCGQRANRLDEFGLCSKITAAHERRRTPGGVR